VGIKAKRVSFSLYGVKVFKCRPVVQHPGDELWPKRSFDLFFYSRDWNTKKLPNGQFEKKKLEILVCFSWLGIKKYRKVKQYSISGIQPFMAKALVHLCIRNYLIEKLGYEILNWK
jgi:hypothetical protein